MRKGERNIFDLLVYKLVFKIYKILLRLPFVKRYLIDLKRMYHIIKPAEERVVILGVMKILFLSLSIQLIIACFSFSFSGLTIYHYGIVGTFIVVIQKELVRITLDREEYKLLQQLEKYLGDVRHYYHVGGMVEEAVFDSMEKADYEVSLHIHSLYEILLEEKKEQVDKYREIAPNKFFWSFLAICQVALLYGDTLRDGNSLFLTNVLTLKKEVHMELLKRQKVRHTFSGLIFVSLFPILFLKPIENWSISNLPELEKYFAGRYGIIVMVFIFLSTLIAYHIVSRLQDTPPLLKKNHPLLERMTKVSFINRITNLWIYNHGVKAYRLDSMLKRISEGITLRQFLVQKYTLFLCSFIALILISIHMEGVTKWNFIHYTKDFNGTSLVTEGDTIMKMREIIEKVADENKQEKRDDALHKKIHRILRRDFQIVPDTQRGILNEEIISRIVGYQKSGFRWYYMVLALFISMGIGYIPFLALVCRRLFLSGDMENEVMQFQSIILMLMYIPRMSVEIILEWLESFSEIFRSSLEECVDHFSYDNEQALLVLKEKEAFLPFVQIVENLEICDRVGIEKAFDEISNQRSFYIEKRKQDNEINITNRSVIGKVVAYIPLVSTITLYLIVPFVLESVFQLVNYLKQIQGI